MCRRAFSIPQKILKKTKESGGASTAWSKADAMTVTPVKWTANDYHRTINASILDDRHTELLDGLIVEMPPIC